MKIKEFGNTLFIVNTPFQCLCMFEAISHFDISKYDVLLTELDNLSTPKVEKLLKIKGISYTKRRLNHAVKTILPLIFSHHKRYKNIFLGYYYNYCDLAASYFYAAFGAQVYYLDDGLQAFEIFSDNLRPRYTRSSLKILMSLYGLVGKV